MANISALIGPPAGPPVSATIPSKQPSMPMENDNRRAVAERFEAAFLAEMLRHSGLGQMPDHFNGGAGEAVFSGTLVQEYANRIAATGTLGIADRVYRTLSERSMK
jgi:Rod binding domain-containing protein